MTRLLNVGSWSVALLVGLAALGCTPGGVGDPCTPEDEYQQDFGGFQVTETNVESRSFQCETRLCLVNHFQGRVSCRLGQSAGEGAPYDLSQGEEAPPRGNAPENPNWSPKCSIPGTAVDRTDRQSPNNIRVQVPAQLQNRQAEKAVYCSCRCDGPEKNARYCECPDGFQCEELVDNLKIPGGAQLAGSYCVRSGSQWNPNVNDPRDCKDNPSACGCTGNPYPSECGAN